MKKVFAMLLMGALSVSLLTACGSDQGAPAADSVTVNQDVAQADDGEETDVLALLSEANKDTALIENNANIGYAVSEYMEDGTVVSMYAYQDQNRYVFEGPAGVTILEQGCLYGFVENTKQLYKSLSVGNALEAYIVNNYMLSFYTPDEAEKLTAAEEKDGMLYIDTAIEDADQVQSLLESYAYGTEGVTKIVTHYVVNPENYEISQMTTAFADAAGEEVVVATMNRVDEVYEVDSELYSGVFEGEMRTKTLIEVAEDGTETVYSQSAPKECLILVMMTEQKELFFDREMTQPYVEPSKAVDEVIYFKKTE